jgi:TP53 regulating kinase-like protein
VLGDTLGKLHSSGIIHGDLTTSNILVEIRHHPQTVDNNNHNNIALIDFGLSHVEDSAEDKGVDLYVLERALSSTFPHLSSFFDQVLESYLHVYVDGGKEVFEKLEEVRLRGRKRTMVG